jgi:hypothetical protein
MTLAQLRSSMSTKELFAWSAYCSLKSEMEDKEMEKARQRAQYRRVR